MSNGSSVEVAGIENNGECIQDADVEDEMYYPEDN
jgi:hypothetical protein